MKYCIENDLSPFEFHDCELTLSAFDGKDLTVSVRYLNIHKNTPQNPSDWDMEIACATMIFRNFNSATYEPGVTMKQDEKGEYHPAEPVITYSGQEAVERILKELKNTLDVFHLEKTENRDCSIGGCGVEPYVTIEFDFDSVTVSWNEYRRKAWYELHREYHYDATLHTPDGDEPVKLTIHCNEELTPPSVTAGCKYGGKNYYGQGSSSLWSDALADLQRQLPEGVYLKGCMTCRQIQGDGSLC